jgi:1-aminocyclopropane-1-carboxylate deaminase
MEDVPFEMVMRWREFVQGPIQQINLSREMPSLSLLRLDLIRSWASGNKYFKLKYVLLDAMTDGIHTIVSKGGMFSNHLAALSDACVAFGLHLVAVIRSYGPDDLNPSIQRLKANGHEVRYVSPAEYKGFDSHVAALLYPGALFIPEGGLSDKGIRGTSEIILESLDYNPSHIIVAGGTMGTACGIAASAPSGTKVIIVPAWKGCTDSYFDEILKQYGIEPVCTWELWPDYHFGGFGKFNNQLIDFMQEFTGATGIPLDPVYTGKVMYAIYNRLRSAYFNDTDSILAVHTGGLQGLEGYKYRFPAAWGVYLPSTI